MILPRETLRYIEEMPGATTPPIAKPLLEYYEKTCEFLDNLPKLTCQSCLGTGLQRTGIISPIPTANPCRECSGFKVSRPYIYNYRLDLQNLAQFVNFVAYSGGFRVE